MEDQYPEQGGFYKMISMVELAQRLLQLLQRGADEFSQLSDLELLKKPGPEKWSKKEILGHLIDSAINNLQRFTEIKYKPKPYRIRNYDQDQLVKANAYQDANLREMLELWISINHRIASVMKQQTKKSLSYQIIFQDEHSADLRFLMIDYVNHLEHHLHQVNPDRNEK